MEEIVGMCEIKRFVEGFKVEVEGVMGLVKRE